MTYGIVWSDGRGPTSAGRLELSGRHLLLEGTTRLGRPTRRLLDYAELTSVRIGRRADERLQGRPALLLQDSSGATTRLACLDGSGRLPELAERLQRLRERSAR